MFTATVSHTAAAKEKGTSAYQAPILSPHQLGLSLHQEPQAI